MSRKCSPIVNINGVPYREGGKRREAGKESGSLFLPCFITKGEKEERMIGRNVFGAQSSSLKVTHWLIQWMLGKRYDAQNSPKYCFSPIPTSNAETANAFQPFHHLHIHCVAKSASFPFIVLSDHLLFSMAIIWSSPDGKFAFPLTTDRPFCLGLDLGGRVDCVACGAVRRLPQ